MPVDLANIMPQLNRPRADRALNIFNRLKLSDVPGQPLLDTACGPWFKTLVEVLAGGLDEDGVQHVRDLLLCVPKKNSKTSYAGLLLLTMMLISPRPRGSFVFVGPTQEVANLAMSQVAGCIYSDPHLRDRLNVRENIKVIEDRKSGSTLAVKSFDLQIATGSRPAGILLDEIWLLSHQDAARVVGQLKGGQASIPEAFTIQTTTQSDSAPQGYFKTEIEKARAIRDGTADINGFLPCIYEPPRDMATSLEGVSSPKVWKMVNPNMDRSVSMDWLKQSFKEAVLAGEQETRRWLSQHANAQVTAYSVGDDAWSGAMVWPKAGTPGITFQSILKTSNRLSLGVDGGAADDLMSLALLGEQPDGAWHVFCLSWVWPIALERRQSISAQLRDYEKQGHLRIVEAGEDLEELVAIILQVRDTGKLSAVGMDPAGVAADLAQMIAHEDPSLAKQLVQVGQGFKLRPAYIALERRLRAGTLRHGSQPILDWAVSNAKQDPQTGLITKKISGVGKIDPLVSTAVAAMVALEAPPVMGNDLSHWVA